MSIILQLSNFLTMKIHNNRIRKMFIGIFILAMLSILCANEVEKGTFQENSVYQIRVKISKIDISIRY